MHTIQVRFIAAGALIALTAACATPSNDPHWQLPGEQHKITVKETNDRLNLVLGRGDGGLSLAHKQAVRNFVHAWRDHGHGPLAISVPSGSVNSETVIAGAAEVREILFKTGINWQQMAGGHYEAHGQMEPPIMLSFRSYRASAQNCSVAGSNLAMNYKNATAPNFGCAVAVNTAAMIADPYDLVQPRKMDPAETDVRLSNYEEYIRGESSATQRSSDEESSISDAVE